MGFRFRKSINLGKGVRINFNKKSAGISFGTKGARYSINSNGRRTASVGIPGTGLYYTKTSGGSSHKKTLKQNKKTDTSQQKMCIRDRPYRTGIDSSNSAEYRRSIYHGLNC